MKVVCEREIKYVIPANAAAAAKFTNSKDETQVMSMEEMEENKSFLAYDFNTVKKVIKSIPSMKSAMGGGSDVIDIGKVNTINVFLFIAVEIFILVLGGIYVRKRKVQ